MRRKLSKKQIGAMGLAVMMGAQTPAMATETSQEAATQELQIVEPQTEETLTEEAQSETQTTEVQVETQAEEIQTQELEIAEPQQTEEQEQETLTETSTEASIEELIDQYALTENQEVLTDGWHQDSNGNYMYVKDGVYLTNTIAEINGSYYGFDYNGIMYADDYFTLWDSESQCQFCYRAKANGSLYVNEWYIPESDYENPYYYGEEGKAYTDLHEVDGTLYYFSWAGQMYKNEGVTAKNGEIYYCDSNGQATKVENNSWLEVDGKYLYVKDGNFLKRCVEKIGDAYYGFDNHGIMYADDYFDFWDSESEHYAYYRAKKDGSLYVNEWYKPENRNPYYFGEKGKAYYGLHEVDGTLYYFDEMGQIYISYALTMENGENYYCDINGKTTKIENNSWFDADGKYVYVKDGKFLSDCVEKIGNAYYGFNYDGFMYVDDDFSFWDGENQRSIYYRAKSDGSLYVNEWYISEYDNRVTYYYGDEGKAYTGLHEVDGILYYFSNVGQVYKNQSITTENGENYYCDANGKATKVENNSWFEADGKYLYVKDGKFLENCVEKIGDAYYGFNYNGFMYADTSFYFWNPENQNYIYYRAKEDGSLYVNEWYISSSSYDNPYYYGEDAKAYTGLHEVDGILYYFNNAGEIYKNRSITTKDGVNYYCDANGNAIKIETDGWFEADGKYVYVKDGKFLTESVALINGVYYGFDSKGIMYTDESFSTWDDKNNVRNYYRAKKDGSLYVNEWYENYRKFYYGEEGKAYSGFKTVDGKQYYFDYDGEAMRNYCTSVDGKNIYCDNDGTVYELNDNGWNKVGDDYLYVKDGKTLRDCVAQIDGCYYAFRSSGVMYRDVLFNMRNDGNDDYYWASPSGVLYTNTWRNEGDNIYYYGADAKRCKGVQNINGVQYGFNNSGNLVMLGTVTLDGVNYYCDEEGRIEVIPDNQWYKSVNGDWYYSQDGILLKNCTTQINGAWYRFDDQGRMQTQGLNVNADGSLQINTWAYDGSDWYYYGEDGQAYKNGIYEIAGVNYYFVSGKMVTSDVISTNGTSYIVDANGYLTKIPENGWIQAGSDYYYAEDGKLVTWKVKEINGVYYAFDGSGKMVTDGEYLLLSGRCRARVDGSLYVSQWYQDLDGSWYYYNQNAVRVIDEAEINGVHYLFDTTNALKTNGVVQRSGKYYLADENGIWVQTPGWVQKNNCWYYVQQDGTLYQGLLKDGGYTYYMSPRMMMDLELTAVDGIAYTIDRNGHASVAADGFYTMGLSNPLLYYISDGKSAEKGWKQINGSWYYFEDADLNGMHSAKTGTCSIDGKYYRFNSDGTLASAGWHLESSGIWYYVDASGALAKGDTWLNGTLYHFNDYGELKNGAIVEDGKCNLYSDDGTLLESGAAQGWNYIGGAYYYLKGDSLLKGSHKLEDGKWYTFDSEGRMLVNGQSNGRWYGEFGAAQTGWFTVAGDWYYASPINGRLYKGLHTINGVQYYFDNTGVMQTGEVISENHVLTINSSGVVTGTKEMQDGWSCYDEEWYYYQNGKPYTGWVGAYYVSAGKMLCNSEITWNDKTYYLGEDGTYKTNAWILDGRYYAKADGSEAQSEWLEIDGNLYYFNSWGANIRYPNYYSEAKETGIYREDGAYISSEGYAQGWALIDGSYYYKEGENFVVNQTKKINGDWYLFDAHGKMVTGFSTYEYDSSAWVSYYYDWGKFYYGQDGRRCYYVGWQVIDGKWYYFDTASESATGWQIINGARYYFDTESRAMVTGYHVINNKLYYFDANGVCQGVSGPQDGWYQADGKWYYIRGGRALTSERTVINNAWYEFDENGVWITE